MIPKNFVYLSPRTTKEAVSLLNRYKQRGRLLAGGMSLIPAMKLRLVAPSYLIDIAKLRPLDFIRKRGEKIVIGALTTHHSIEKSEILKSYLPLMPKAASLIGDPQVRNMGTIGGSLCHADPAGDWGAVILALKSKLTAVRSRGRRRINADEFFVSPFQTSLKSNELLERIEIDIPQGRNGYAYLKLERKAGDFATVGVAVQLSLDENDKCKDIGIGLAAVAPVSKRARKAEQALLGKVLDESSINQAAEIAGYEDAEPSDDALRGSAEYKREMTKVLTRRALNLALTTAKGGS